MNFEAARHRARELDAHWRQHHSPVGPLHGLPVSLMDRFHVAGLDSACGFTSWVGNKRTANDEGGIVQSLRNLGAVIFCKTNVPMSMMVDLPISLWQYYSTDNRFTDGRDRKQYHWLYRQSIQSTSLRGRCLWWYFVKPSSHRYIIQLTSPR